MSNSIGRPAVVGDVVPGAVLYKAYCLTGNNGELEGWVKRMDIAGMPYEERGGLGLFAEHHAWDKTFSLMDAGIIPNSYNNHKTFTTAESAQKYLDRFLATGKTNILTEPLKLSDLKAGETYYVAELWNGRLVLVEFGFVTEQEEHILVLFKGSTMKRKLSDCVELFGLGTSVTVNKTFSDEVSATNYIEKFNSLVSQLSDLTGVAMEAVELKH